MTLKNNIFNNKNILITGGTSGLGLALTEALIQRGAKVAIIARTKYRLEDLKLKLKGLHIIEGDVSRKETLHSLAAQAIANLGPINYLFNVASYLGDTPLRLLLDTDCEDFEQVLQTNLFGPFRLTKLIAPLMIEQRQGAVINISSDAAINPYPRWGSYGVSKAALDHLTQIFQEELKGFGIQFLSVDPGDMNTPMHWCAVPDANPNNLKDPKLSAQQILRIIQNNDFSHVRRSV